MANGSRQRGTFAADDQLLGVRNTGPQDFSFFTQDIPSFFSAAIPEDPRAAGRAVRSGVSRGINALSNIPIAGVLPPPLTGSTGAARDITEFGAGLLGFQDPGAVGPVEQQAFFGNVGPGGEPTARQIRNEELREFLQQRQQQQGQDQGQGGQAGGGGGGFSLQDFMGAQDTQEVASFPVNVPQRELPPELNLGPAREALEAARPEQVEAFQPGLADFLGAAARGAQGAETVGEVLLGAGGGASRISTAAEQAEIQAEREFQQQLNNFNLQRSQQLAGFEQTQRQAEIQREKVDYINQKLERQVKKPKVDVTDSGIIVSHVEDGERVTEFTPRRDMEDYLDLLDKKMSMMETVQSLQEDQGRGLVQVPIGDQEAPFPAGTEEIAEISGQFAMGNIPANFEGENQVERMKEDFILGRWGEGEIPTDPQERRRALQEARVQAKREGFDSDALEDEAELVVAQKIYQRMMNNPQFRREALQIAAPYITGLETGQAPQGNIDIGPSFEVP